MTIRATDLGVTSFDFPEKENLHAQGRILIYILHRYCILYVCIEFVYIYYVSDIPIDDHLAP